jgi:hypothetical protein
MHCHYGRRCLEIATETNAVVEFRGACERTEDVFAFGECSPEGMAGVCTESTGSGVVREFFAGVLARVTEPNCRGTWDAL